MFFLSRVYDDWKIYYSYSYSCLVGTLVNLFPTRVNFSTRPTIRVKFELIAKVRKQVNTKPYLCFLFMLKYTHYAEVHIMYIV